MIAVITTRERCRRQVDARPALVAPVAAQHADGLAAASEREHRRDCDEERKRREPGSQIAALPLAPPSARPRKMVKAGMNQRLEPMLPCRSRLAGGPRIASSG
jgi:hypothetical protein